MNADGAIQLLFSEIRSCLHSGKCPIPFREASLADFPFLLASFHARVFTLLNLIILRVFHPMDLELNLFEE